MRKPKSKYKGIFSNYIKNNAREYGIVILIFLIGLILGVIFINNVNETQETEIGGYISNFITSLKENSIINNPELLKSSVINNCLLALLLWFVGSTVVGMPLLYLIIGFRGFCLGYTIASVLATLGTINGLLFTLATILFQNILLIPCILAIAVSGIKLHKSITKDKRRDNIKMEIMRHTIFSLVMTIILIFSSFIEVYISGNLTMWISKFL